MRSRAKTEDSSAGAVFAASGDSTLVHPHVRTQVEASIRHPHEHCYTQSLRIRERRGVCIAPPTCVYPRPNVSVSAHPCHVPDRPEQPVRPGRCAVVGYFYVDLGRRICNVSFGQAFDSGLLCLAGGAADGPAKCPESNSNGRCAFYDCVVRVSLLRAPAHTHIVNPTPRGDPMPMQTKRRPPKASGHLVALHRAEGRADGPRVASRTG